MAGGRVEICGVSTSRLPVLTSSEKKELLKRAAEGDTEAREKLIDGNLRLVLSLVGRFSGRGENPDDLFQVGCIGLIKAVDNFDTGLDVEFSTYAVPMILGEIRRYLRDNNVIRVSRSVRDLAYRALAAREKLSAEGEPTLEAVAAELGEDPAEVGAALEAIAEPVSLFDTVSGDGGDSLCVMDQIRDRDADDELWLEDIALRDALARLSERERSVIAGRYYAGKTQMEIAQEIGISQAQVSRIEKGAIDRIRRSM